MVESLKSTGMSVSCFRVNHQEYVLFCFMFSVLTIMHTHSTSSLSIRILTSQRSSSLIFLIHANFIGMLIVLASPRCVHICSSASALEYYIIRWDVSIMDEAKINANRAQIRCYFMARLAFLLQVIFQRYWFSSLPLNSRGVYLFRGIRICAQ